MIWVNDISYRTETRQFADVYKLFKKYLILNTVALECKDIEKNPELIKFIKKNNIDVQVNCWEHSDLTKQTALFYTLGLCLRTIEKHFYHAPDTLYPPFGKSDEKLIKTANDHGLTVRTEKMSLSQYIKGAQGEVINVRSWAVDDILLLETALKIYTQNR